MVHELIISLILSTKINEGEHRPKKAAPHNRKQRDGPRNQQPNKQEHKVNLNTTKTTHIPEHRPGNYKWRTPITYGGTGANGTHIGDCTKAHNERTANRPYIKEQGRENGGRFGQGPITILTFKPHKTNQAHQTKQYNNSYTNQPRCKHK